MTAFYWCSMAKKFLNATHSFSSEYAKSLKTPGPDKKRDELTQDLKKIVLWSNYNSYQDGVLCINETKGLILHGANKCQHCIT